MGGPAREAGRRYEGLQQLRLVAAAGILVFHSAHFVGLAAGAPDPFVDFWSQSLFSLGVHLFFGISGFVLMHALTRSTVPRFLAHRLLRIYPPFLLAVAFALGLPWLLFGQRTGVPWKTLTLLPLGPMSLPLLVQWSLTYEIFYYVVAAVLSLLPRRSFRLAAYLAWAGGILVATFIGVKSSFFPTFLTIPWSMFNLCFIGGVLAYEFRDAWGRRPLVLVLVTLIGIAGNYPIDTSIRQYLFLPVATTGLVALAALGSPGAKTSWWRGLLARGGDWSYGLYLLHVAVVTITLRLGAAALAVTHPRLTFLAVALLALILGSAFGAAELALYRRALRTLFPARSMPGA